jgi:acyl-CoA synthetase (AMP-forming)/AMP-acid ligase II
VGERVAAAIVPRPGVAIDASEITEHCRRHIASFKKPTRIIFIDALPKNAYGKVLRSELRDLFEQGLGVATMDRS